jgi:SAM-dependent methyltransferase
MRRVSSSLLFSGRKRRQSFGVTSAARQSGMSVDVEIHPGDDMFGGDLDVYLAVGRSALHVIESTLGAAGCDSPESILDLPCGHGRVLRHLRHRWPDARIVCCDLDRSGVDFCAAHFNAEPVYSRTDPAEIPISDRFDLIWVGSLLTHLDEPLWREFLRFFFDRLTTDGLLIFTTHGRFDATRDTAIASAAWDFARVGFGYYEPADRPGYGLSYASPAWVFHLVSQHPGRLVTYWERGWNDHQDVVAVSAASYYASWRRPN